MNQGCSGHRGGKATQISQKTGHSTGRHLGDRGSSPQPAPPSPSRPACRCDSAAIACITSAWLRLTLLSLLGFAEPGKSIAAVCRWPAQGEGSAGGEAGAEGRTGDREGPGGPQGLRERQQSCMAGEGLDGEDLKGFVSHPRRVWRTHPADAAPSSQPPGRDPAAVDTREPTETRL